MILHILKKDLVQLAPLIAIVGLAQLISAAIWFALGHFAEPRGLVTIAYLLAGAAVLGIAALITAAVHLEMLPGINQDWLIRPILPTDLLCAKLLFLLIAVHGPMLLADVATGLGTGFTVSESLRSAVLRSLHMLFVLELPVLALAAITRSLVQVGAAVLAIWLVTMIGVAVGILARSGNPPPFAASGLQWMTPAYWSLLAMAAAVLVIPVQYLRRATNRTRLIVASAAVLAPLLSFSSWGMAFDIQTWFSINTTVTQPLAIEFDSSIGPSDLESSPTTAFTPVYLPLRVTNLPHDSMVLNDRTFITLVAPDGTTLYRGRTTTSLGYGDDFPVRTDAASTTPTHQRVEIPVKVYESVRAQPVRVELEYSLTLFQFDATTTMTAMEGSAASAAFGSCKTHVDEDGDGVKIGCLRPQNSPACVTALLTNSTTGKTNPEAFFCDPDYAPSRSQIFPGVMSRFGGELKFRDLQRLAKYPVDGTQLADAQVVLKSWAPTSHFSRQVVITGIRLEDWALDARARQIQSK